MRNQLNSWNAVATVSIAMLTLANAGWSQPPQSGGPAVASAPRDASIIAIKTAILKPPVSVAIAAGVPGVIDRVMVKEGDVVTEGAPLLKIRDDEARMALQQAMLSVEIAQLKSERNIEIRLAEKSSQVAEQELNRALRANELAPDTYPPNEVDRYKLVYERSQLEIERAKLEQASARMAAELATAEKSQAQLRVERHMLQSPIRGIVASVDRQIGEWTDANSQCLELVAVEQLRLEGFVDADEAGRLTVGDPGRVRITTPSGSMETDAKISFISPQANPVNGQIKIFMEVDNRQGKLRPGLPVTATAQPRVVRQAGK